MLRNYFVLNDSATINFRCVAHLYGWNSYQLLAMSCEF